MGKTGRLGPPAFDIAEEGKPLGPQVIVVSASQTVVLRGSDLYRLNCQGCHGESGQGAPPEIHSVINPVRATSPAAVIDRMKSTGMEVSRVEAAQMAAQAQKALLERLHKGGQDMPAFPHLSEPEIRSLISYLRKLAALPGAGTQEAGVRESVMKVGEHVAKSTCNVCHDASGPNPSLQELMEGVIPALSTLTSRVSQADFIRKVTQGAPITMGTPKMLYRGRMPVFHYLSREDAANVYLYLTLYPPTSGPATDPGSYGSESQKQAAIDVAGDRLPVASAFSSTRNSQHAAQNSAASSGDLLIVLLIVAAWMAVIVIVAGGLSFTLREFKRLSPKGKTVDRDGTRDHRSVGTAPEESLALLDQT
jgi:mono/diheme cytochrome c family protein